MALKPWYKVATPREDLREGKPLDASEFAVHLDQVRDNRAPEVYQKPEQFFERTFLTQNLLSLAAETVRRLSGEKTETSAVFNMSTQFGGGKTHALTLLYHLANHGPAANRWLGVEKILEKAGMPSVPKAATAVFVGTEFDSITGRGGKDGTPLRKTPWGEIAYQLGDAEAFDVVAEHDYQMVAPAGDVIRRFLPGDRPCIILMDEILNYVSRSRKSGMATQLYNFLQNLSEEARARNNMVLAVSIPASEIEMSVEDQLDHERYKKLLDRLGKAIIMSAESETSEIIRRRLFEWDNTAVSKDGKILLSQEAIATCKEYAKLAVEQRQQIPNWFPVDNAREAFEANYPFHPMVLSVFERKWQALPRFQRTRGILRLLALWVSRAYQEGFKGAHRDALISLGSAPLDDPLFRPAMYEQLGEQRLEGAITTDICGKQDAHAIRLDKEAVEAIKKARLHRKAATAIFFESNGGQARAEATIPEIRLAVLEPELELGHIETVLESLASTCFYLSVERNRYRFSLAANLNKMLADRRASIKTEKIEECVREEVQKIFSPGPSTERVFFPAKSNDIPDRPVLTLVVLPPDQSAQDEKTLPWIESKIREYGSSARTFKNALIWCVPENTQALYEEARKVLAWEAIDEQDRSDLGEEQQRQLDDNIKKAQRDLKEAVWRSYKKLMLLGKDNTLRVIDLGLVHSSAANSIIEFFLNRLKQDDEVVDNIGPITLIRNWPPAFKEWSTKAVRDAIFASPQFPRLIRPELIKETIARGVSNGSLAYVGIASINYDPFFYTTTINANDVEISDEMFIISKETAESYLNRKENPQPAHQYKANEDNYSSDSDSGRQNAPEPVLADQPVSSYREEIHMLAWSGEIPLQKWTNFYMKILTKFAAEKGLKLTLNLSLNSEDTISPQKIEETRVALRELGLDDDIEIN